MPRKAATWIYRRRRTETEQDLWGARFDLTEQADAVDQYVGGEVRASNITMRGSKADAKKSGEDVWGRCKIIVRYGAGNAAAGRSTDYGAPLEGSLMLAGAEGGAPVVAEGADRSGG